MLKIGLEKEFFCVNSTSRETEIVPEKLMADADDCGWLFEARGLPMEDPTDAIYSLLAAIDRLNDKIVDYNRFMEPTSKLGKAEEDIRIIPETLRVQARRRFTKGLLTYQNIYGYTHHRTRARDATAGVHVNFSVPATHYKNGTTHEYNRMFDFASIIRMLDEKFAEEIKASRRRPGFYEVKSGGIFEYRSLPSTVSTDKLKEALLDVAEENW